MGDSEERPSEQEANEEERLTAQWSVEDEEEAARERRRRERERQGQSQEDDELTSPSVENGVSEVLDNRCGFKPIGSSELEEDEGFSDWSLKLEQRKQRSGAQEAASVCTMSGTDAEPQGGEDVQGQQRFGFKPFTAGFAGLQINSTCEFEPSDDSRTLERESPEEGLEEDMQARMKNSPPSSLSPSANEEDDAGLGEAEALRAMGTLSRYEEESRDLERTIQREAELEELKQEARRRQQEEEAERQRKEEEQRLEEEKRRWEEEVRRREEEQRLHDQEARRLEEEEHRRALEEAEKLKAEEEEHERQRWEAAEQRLKTLSCSGSDGDEANRPLSPLSPTIKILERTESLNRSIKKSNSVKKTQPALPISKIDDRLEQYTHAIESSAKTPKLQRQPSIELISTVEAVANKKNLFETCDISAQNAVKVTPTKDTEGLNVGVSDLIHQFAKGTPGSKSPPKAGGSSGNKKYKFVPVGHGKYEKVLIDDHEDH
ncbi:lymphocyte-specific protein 1 isoform X2 [Lissotriton helveticus]